MNAALLYNIFETTQPGSFEKLSRENKEKEGHGMACASARARAVLGTWGIGLLASSVTDMY